MKRIFVAVAVLALFVTGTAWAQNRQEMAEMQKVLPAAALPTMQRLGELNRLPQGEWRAHDGDIPHGERAELDDSSWAVAKMGSQYGSDAVWFRRWIVVPPNVHGYDLTGARIWFRFQARIVGTGSLNEIVYFNGSRVALGESLEQLELVSNAKPGEKILVAVKLLGTDNKKMFQGSMERVEFSADRPNPQDLRDEFMTAAELIPSVSKNIPDDQATLLKAIQQVDVKALDAGDQKKFDASLEVAKLTLAVLKPEMQQLSVAMDGNAHIDAAWLWPRSETIDVVKRTFGTALQLMHEYPGYVYTQSAAQYNEWMADKYPDMEKDIQQRIKEGRWEVVGGMWVEPDLNIPDGESTARSILLGKRWYQKNYGVDVQIGWNPDSFGYNWQLPQIYKKSGINYFVTQKMSWNDTNQLPFKLFWWESPDGSKVMTYFPHGYGNNQLNPAHYAADLKTARQQSPGLPSILDLYGVGDHGGGPTRDMLDEGEHWMHTDAAVPTMKFSRAIDYFDSMSKMVAPDSKTWDYESIAMGYEYPAIPSAGEVSIPTWKDEMYLEFHRGVYTTQAKMKNNLRQGPIRTLDAEKVASLAWLDGVAYPQDQLTDAWEKITFNGFHDLAAGSGIAVIYRDAQKDFNQVYWETDVISAKSLNTLAAHVDTKVTGVPVFVFNPLAWTRSGTVNVDVQMPAATSAVSVMDSHGKVLPSEVLSSDAGTHTFHLLVKSSDVPSMGYAVLHVVPTAQKFASDLKVSGTTLENADLRVVVDPKTGCITSLYDKKSGFESLAAGSCGNELQAFKDNPKQYDAWNIDPGTLDVPPTLLTMADSVKVTEDNPMRGIITVSRHWQGSKFVQQIILETGSDEVNVVNDIDWHETHILLKTAFALAASSNLATYEIPYGTIERPTTRDNSWEKARFEVPAQYWADLGNGQHGVSLINDSKFGYDAVGNLLRLSLLRSPVSPDPDADRGHQHFSYALYPHAGDWKQAMTERRGYEYNFKLSAMQVEPHSGEMSAEHSFVKVAADNVVLTAMKKAEDSNSLVFHMYEWAGKSGDVNITVPAGATSAEETNLMEKSGGPSLELHDGVVTVPVHPFEIVAVRVNYAK